VAAGVLRAADVAVAAGGGEGHAAAGARVARVAEERHVHGAERPAC
jgi:hypothetical protein